MLVKLPHHDGKPQEGYMGIPIVYILEVFSSFEHLWFVF